MNSVGLKRNANLISLCGLKVSLHDSYREKRVRTLNFERSFYLYGRRFFLETYFPDVTFDNLP